MKRKVYERYKPSGAEWLGEIPEHWVMKRLKYAAHIIMGQSPNSEDYMDDSDATPFLQGNADFASRFPVPRVFCDAATKMVQSGALLISVRAPVGAINEADRTYGIGRGLCAVITNKEGLGKSYLWYLLQVTREELNVIATGSTYDAVSVDEVGAMAIHLPHHLEQEAISAFLDRETSRIDDLMGKKQRQIELLQEKRSAFISHVVTKGLDQDVKMKDSGVEWLGEIPEHWSILPLKRLARVRYGLGQPPKETSYGLPLLRATNIKQGRIIPEGLILADPSDIPSSRDALLRENEILVVRSGAYTGDSAIVRKEYAGAVAGYDLVVTVFEGLPDYFAWQFLGPEIYGFQFQAVRLRAAQPHMNAEELGNTIVVSPPLRDQETIVEFIDQETSRMDKLVENINESIDLLREYRTALISATVTGKIDVREEVA